jgi:hypothetical protein
VSPVLGRVTPVRPGDRPRPLGTREGTSQARARGFTDTARVLRLAQTSHGLSDHPARFDRIARSVRAGDPAPRGGWEAFAMASAASSGRSRDADALSAGERLVV